MQVSPPSGGDIEQQSGSKKSMARQMLIQNKEITTQIEQLNETMEDLSK